MNYNKRMVDALQVPGMEKREVSSYGLALVISTVVLRQNKGMEYGDLYISIEKIIYKISDLAIIDVSAVKNFAKNILKFKMSQYDISNIIASNTVSLESTLGIDEYFSSALIENCKKYSDVLRESIAATILYIQEEKLWNLS